MSLTWATMQGKASHLLASTHLGQHSSATSRSMVFLRLSSRRIWTLSKSSCVNSRRAKLQPLPAAPREAAQRSLRLNIDEVRMHNNKARLHRQPRPLPTRLGVRFHGPLVHLTRAPPPILRARPSLSLLSCLGMPHPHLRVHQWLRPLYQHRRHLHAPSRSHHPRRRLVRKNRASIFATLRPRPRPQPRPRLLLRRPLSRRRLRRPTPCWNLRVMGSMGNTSGHAALELSRRCATTGDTSYFIYTSTFGRKLSRRVPVLTCGTACSKREDLRVADTMIKLINFLTSLRGVRCEEGLTD